MGEKKIILTHPALGDRPFNEVTARKLMAMVNNGGWEFKKPTAASKGAAVKNQTDASNDSTDTGDTQNSEEEGRN